MNPLFSPPSRPLSFGKAERIHPGAVAMAACSRARLLSFSARAAALALTKSAGHRPPCHPPPSSFFIDSAEISERVVGSRAVGAAIYVIRFI